MSIMTGLAVGLVTVPYRYLIEHSVGIRDYIYAHTYAWYYDILIIIGIWAVGLLLYLMVQKVKYINGSGIPQVEGYICNRFPLIASGWRLILKFIGGIVGIGMGFSLGREGPSVQIGAFIGDLIGKWTKVDVANKRFLITGGAAAGLSSAFTAPLASTIFVHEEITKYQSSRSTVTAFLAAIASGWMAKLAFGNEDKYSLLSSAMPNPNEIPTILATMLALAIFLSLFGMVFNYLLIYFKEMFTRFKKRSKFAPYILFLGLAVITYFLGYFIPDILAGGEPLIFKYADTKVTIWLVIIMLVVKLVYTPLCYCTGVPGGIFLPLLVIGALSGKLFCLLLCEFGLPYQAYSGFFMLMSMGGIFAVVVRSPLTGLVLMLEMTNLFTDFFWMIVLVGVTFFISQLMRVQPIYDLLYRYMLPEDYETSDEKIFNYYKVLDGSYLIGKPVHNITVPGGSAIVRYKRDDVWNSTDDVILQKDDVLEVQFTSKDLETLSKAYRVLCNE
ncbi:MAG: ClC family H(+)/Cl(-) exchange transporter [Marinifilaceae bacterium]